MDDFFGFSLPDFSFPDFSGLTNLFPSMDTIFSNLGGALVNSIPQVAQHLTGMAVNRIFGGQNGGAILSQAPGVLFGGGKNLGLPRTTPGIVPDFNKNYFQASQGQSMAQLAAMISRASRRFL